MTTINNNVAADEKSKLYLSPFVRAQVVTLDGSGTWKESG